MVSGGPAVMSQSALAAASPPEHVEIESRFGRISVNPQQAIQFPSGLLGMPDAGQFCLTHFPSEKMARFKILQSLDDYTLAFITLPVDVENPIVDRADIELAAKDLEVAVEDLVILLITTVHRDAGGVHLTVNARAPVFLHVPRRVAAQYVFPNTRYQIRQPLSM